ncbi:hypothetical protein D3C71_1730870 [compost metagenome]
MTVLIADSEQVIGLSLALRGGLLQPQDRLTVVLFTPCSLQIRFTQHILCRGVVLLSGKRIQLQCPSSVRLNAGAK